MAGCENESAIPLKQHDVDGDTTVQSTGKAGLFGGLFLNKTKLIILAAVILILIIIIIVLAAVLGHERAKGKRELTRKYGD